MADGTLIDETETIVEEMINGMNATTTGMSLGTESRLKTPNLSLPWD
jgi:hypothetical protein